MGNLFTSNRRPRGRSDIYMRGLDEPLLESSLNDLVNQKTDKFRDEIDRLKVELSHCRSENRSLKTDLQKIQTNYGKEIFTLGESCSSLGHDTNTLMKNQEIIQELLQKILQIREREGKTTEASIYASVHSLTSSESRM